MKRLEIALLMGLVIGVAGVLFQLPFASACEQVRDDTLRVHILAHSDAPADQSLKLQVRDAVVEYCTGRFQGADSRDQAVQRAQASLGEIEAVAGEVLAAAGADYGVRAEVCEMYFDKRVYEDVTLPAGTYTALRLILGEGAGRNWWCVVYPSLCFAASEEDLSAYSEEELSVVLGGERCAVRFKIEEWFQQLFHALEW